jgi:hypothetical protein
MVIGILLICLVSLIISAGCVSAAAPPAPAVVHNIEPIPITSATIAPVETVTTLPVYEESYQDWKFRNRMFNLSEWLMWRRDDVSGEKDMVVLTTIYGYRFEPNYQEHSSSWGTNAWFTHVPSDGMKYLFVYVCMYMDGTTIERDPRMYAMGSDHFTVQVGNQFYYPLKESDPKEPIKELEYVWDIDHVHTIKPYAYGDLTNTVSGSKIYESTWLRMGRSNKMDGWLLYEVPANTRPEDISVLGRFDNLGGYAFWSLMK